MTDEQWQEIKMNYESGSFINADTIDKLFEEVKRLRAEVERLQHQAIGLSESASKSLILYANAGTEADGLRAEVERLQEEIERLRVEGTSPKPGFLTWAMQVEDALPPGMAKGVNVEELRWWFEEGMTVEGAAEEVARSGQRVRDDITGQ